MIKTYTITLHDINNPGSSLQAYALNRYINTELKEVTNFIIDYQPRYSKIGKNKIRGILRRVLYYKNEIMTDRKYRDFKKQYMVCTEKYKSVDEMKRKLPQAECYIVGSDQLWNGDYDCGNDEAFYLDFVRGKKISYATSVGKSHISEKEISKLRSSVSVFSHLSLREESSAKELSKILDRNVEWVCDPVFLLERADYEALCSYSSNLDEKYAVVYMTAQSSLLDAAVNYAKREGLKVVQIDGNRKRCDCDIHVPSIGPCEFLGYIKNAELVISSSFHATCFSLIFQRRFIVIPPEHNAERIYSILKLVNNMDRVVKKEEDILNASKMWDAETAMICLKEFIMKSKQYLSKGIMNDDTFSCS